VREQVEAQLQHQVMHDALTGLPNRVYLRDRIERAIAGLRRDEAAAFGLLYIDVDRFKVVNDSLGHSAGDAVLQAGAKRLAACVREPDVVARMAGDEFVMLLEHVQQPETACKVAQRVLRALQPPLHVAGREIQLSCSIGIAIAGPACESADRILHDADVALYRAKDRRRNRFVLFDDAMHQTAMGVLDLEQALRDALLRDEFEAVVPAHRAPGRRERRGLRSAAALAPSHARRAHARRFLKVAEDSGLIGQIDWRMFRLALEARGRWRAIARWRARTSRSTSRRACSSTPISTSACSTGRRDRIRSARAAPGSHRRHAARRSGNVVATLHRLRERGVEAALDDFGTGYSSLGHVHQFPLKMIKIDQSFVAPFANGVPSRSSALIEAILALGNALGTEIVAEGVETDAQWAVLRAMGCVYGQGYRFAYPRPPALAGTVKPGRATFAFHASA
jgi:diguanylate cyclase (GGDEF)-like protein